MLLKIKGIKSHDWWLYDNIVKIHYTHLKNISLSTHDFDVIVHIENSPNDSDVKNIVDGTSMIVRDKEDKEFSIFFDTIAYICNDEGKTIEKICVNG